MMKLHITDQTPSNCSHTEILMPKKLVNIDFKGDFESRAFNRIA